METDNFKKTQPADAPPNSTPAPVVPEQPREWNSNRPNRSTSRIYLAVGVIAIIVIAVVLLRRDSHSTPVAADSVVVGVAKVTREDLFDRVTYPAEFRPYAEVELHAKVSGYVDQMNVDFGDKVKAGQLLATLEVPELRDQLHNAIAMRQKAEADYTNANLLYDRLQSVNQQHSNLVAQQDLDNAQAKQNSAAAAIAAAKADVERYQTLTNYTRITAPFDGVITKRYADTGTLIQAGTTSDTQSMPLVRVSDNYHLRLDFQVSVKYVKDIHVGDAVKVRVESLGDKTFTGTISRATGRVNSDTRTMIVEVDVDNVKLEIVPGMYCYVELRVDPHPHTLTVPTEAVSGEKNPTVYLVNDKSEIESRPITLGLEAPDKYEILAGLKEGDLVMIGSRALIQPGQKVETKLVTPLKIP